MSFSPDLPRRHLPLSAGAVNRRYVRSMIPPAYLTVVLTGILVIFVSKALDLLWARTIPVRGMYLLMRAPGIVIHECSHILGCLLTGAKVKDVVFFSKEGGSVTYAPSPVPFLGDVVINTAPLFCIPLVLYACTWIFSSYLGCSIPALPPGIGSAGAVSLMASQTAGMFAANLLYHFNPWFLVYLYLTVSLVLSLAPSRQDMKNAAFGIAIIVAGGALVFWSTFSPAVSLLEEITDVIGISFGIALGFGVIALVISLPPLIIYACRR